MKTNFQTCQSCGSDLEGAVTSFGVVCRVCALRASCTPGTAGSEANTTWAEVFPQLEVESTIREREGESIYIARVLDGEEGCRAILQVATGEALIAAGGATGLGVRVRDILEANHEGLTPILDSGDLADAFFLVAKAPDLSRLSEILVGRDAEEIGLLVESAAREAAQVSKHASRAGFTQPFDPDLCFVDEDTGQVVIVPSLLPGDAEWNESPVPEWTIAEDCRLGAFSLKKRIGEGGFGEVWEARQERPVARTVALKILKSGLNSQRLRTRFELEQQALARLDHPHIARFFDGETTPDGRPYFAMEWIDGKSVTDHCRNSHADLSERLRLFRQVCEGVHHAHQKGIIHRDLKASNVMVSSQGDEASVKVIDFGIARVAETPELERTRVTRANEILGTPAAMSPEQAGGAEGSELDARTDVYGLGVLLYELLTGQLPFDPKLPPDELRRRIREDEPLKPSCRPAGKDQARSLKGDLDWITMRCLEKDPARRYSSVSTLLADLRRLTREEPIEAGPPRWSYRVGKFWRRNRGAVVSAVVIAATLVAATVISVAQAKRAEREGALARDAERVADERRLHAEENRQAAEAVVAFFDQIFASNDPWKQQGRNATIDEALTAATQRLGTNKSITEEWRIELLQILARSFKSLGEAEKAVPLVEEAVERAEAHFGRSHDKTIETLHNLGVMLNGAGRYEEAIDVQEEVIARKTEVKGDLTQGWDLTRHNLALDYFNAGRHAEARDILEQLVKAKPDYAYLQEHLAAVLAGLGENDRAILIVERIISSGSGTTDPEGMKILRQRFLGRHYLLDGDPKVAVDILEGIRPRFIERWGLQHDQTLSLFTDLGRAYKDLGQYNRSIDLIQGLLRDLEDLAQSEDDSSDLQQKLLIISGNLGNSLQGAGRGREAIEVLEPLIPQMEATEGFDPKKRLAYERTLAMAHVTLGEFAQAAEIIEKTLPSYEFGADPEADFDVTEIYPLCYSERGQHDKAIEILRDLIASGTQANGPESSLVRHTIHELGKELIRAGQAGEAAELLKDLLAELPQGTGFPWRPDVMRSLASAYRELGRSEEEAQVRAERRAETLAHVETAYAKAVLDEERSAEVLVPVGSSWRWSLPSEAGRAQVAAHFSKPDFDDTAWARSADSLLGGFGIEDLPNQWMDAVNLGDPDSPEAHGHGPAFFRHRFTTNEAHLHLELVAQVADGVCVFLDGVEAARRNVQEGEMVTDLHALNDPIGHAAWTPIRIPLKGRLEPGEHALAISLHGHAGWKRDLRLAGIQLVSWSTPTSGPPLADEPLVEPEPGPFDPEAFADTMHGLSLREVRQGNQARARDALALSIIGRLLAEEENWAGSADALAKRYEEWRALTYDEYAAPARSVLIKRGAGWRFHACNEATAAPAGWTTARFDDSNWGSGAAPLGYGDPAVVGEVATGEEPDGKPRTVLFRRTFAVESDAPFDLLFGRLRADDGAAVYVNGQEVQRLRLPEGVLEPSVFASKAVFGGGEATYTGFKIPAHVLKPGENLIAAEVHQRTAKSSDVIFDLELQGIWLAEFQAVLESVEPEEALDKIRRTYHLKIHNLPQDWREQSGLRLKSVGG